MCVLKMCHVLEAWMKYDALRTVIQGWGLSKGYVSAWSDRIQGMPSRVEGFAIPVKTSIHCDILLFTVLYTHIPSFIFDSLYTHGMRQLWWLWYPTQSNYFNIWTAHTVMLIGLQQSPYGMTELKQHLQCLYNFPWI